MEFRCYRQGPGERLRDVTGEEDVQVAGLQTAVPGRQLLNCSFCSGLHSKAIERSRIYPSFSMKIFRIFPLMFFDTSDSESWTVSSLKAGKKII